MCYSQQIFIVKMESAFVMQGQPCWAMKMHWWITWNVLLHLRICNSFLKRPEYCTNKEWLKPSCHTPWSTSLPPLITSLSGHCGQGNILKDRSVNRCVLIFSLKSLTHSMLKKSKGIIFLLQQYSYHNDPIYYGMGGANWQRIKRTL